LQSNWRLQVRWLVAERGGLIRLTPAARGELGVWPRLVVC